MMTTTADSRVCTAATLAAALPLNALGWSLETPSWSAKSLVIYAPGHGLGHLVRALNLARLLGPATIVHSVTGPIPLPIPSSVELLPFAQFTTALTHAQMLIVDTFPKGINGELTTETLAKVPVTVLIRRYLKTETYPGYHAAAAHYTAALRPYPDAACEWEGEGIGAAIGYLVRPLTLGPADSGFTVLGRFAGLTMPFTDLLAAGDHQTGVYDSLPNRPTVALGAGYNTTYELLTLGLPFVVLPVAKRFDDPWHRAALLERTVHSQTGLRTFLGDRA